MQYAQAEGSANFGDIYGGGRGSDAGQVGKAHVQYQYSTYVRERLLQCLLLLHI